MTVVFTPRIVFVRWVIVKTSRTWSPSSSPREVNTVPGLSGNHGFVTCATNRSGLGNGGFSFVDVVDPPALTTTTITTTAAIPTRMSILRMGLAASIPEPEPGYTAQRLAPV